MLDVRWCLRTWCEAMNTYISTRLTDEIIVLYKWRGGSQTCSVGSCMCFQDAQRLRVELFQLKSSLSSWASCHHVILTSRCVGLRALPEDEADQRLSDLAAHSLHEPAAEAVQPQPGTQRYIFIHKTLLHCFKCSIFQGSLLPSHYWPVNPT